MSVPLQEAALVHTSSMYYSLHDWLHTACRGVQTGLVLHRTYPNLQQRCMQAAQGQLAVVLPTSSFCRHHVMPRLLEHTVSRCHVRKVLIANWCSCRDAPCGHCICVALRLPLSVLMALQVCDLLSTVWRLPTHWLLM